MKKILLLSFILIFSGCLKRDISNTKLSKLTKRDDIYYVALLNTQKGQIVASLETKALLIATYLNPVFRDKPKCSICFDTSDGDYFLVGLFINGERESKFGDSGYNINLNGVEPIDLKEVDRYDPLLKEMPMVNNWSSYYIAKFPKQDREKLILNFKSDLFGEDKLEFLKRDNKL
jgi:hypothetical protein